MGKFLLIIAAIAVGFLAVRYAKAQRSENSDGGTATLQDLQRLVERIATTGKNGAFWVLLIPDTARSDGFAANLQVSMESGALGLDWVLLAERNVEDRAKFVSVVAAQGLEPKQLVGNGVHYLRFEGSDHIADLCATVLQSMYGVTDSTQMQLITTDFAWP